MKLGMDSKFVHCRNYALSTVQMKKAMHQPGCERKFLDYMIVEKTAWLNNLGGDVVYVDDMAHRFNRDLLYRNIGVFNQEFQLLGGGRKYR